MARGSRVLFVLTEVVRLVLTVVYLMRDDLDGLSAVLLMLSHLSLTLLAVRLMSKGAASAAAGRRPGPPVTGGLLGGSRPGG